MPVHYHWPALGLAILVGVIIQFIWTAPFALGPLWAKVDGHADGQTPGLWPRLGFVVLAYALLAFILAGFFNYIGSADFIQGAMAGLQMGGGCALASLLLAQAHSPRPWAWMLVHAAPMILASLLMGGVLGAWR